MIDFKDDVSLDGVQKECIKGMYKVARLFTLIFGRDLVVTSVSDGKHKKNSLHYKGLAFDIRTWTTQTSGLQMSLFQKNSLQKAIMVVLGDDWDVVVESTHIHCEYDPE